MKYGHFDNDKKEYVIDRVDLPVSWTNYLGVEDMCTVINHTAGGYSFYKSPEYHRITRFRGNSVPMDRPGHYVYIRDDEDGDYWSISWQPVGKPLDEASYRCRHGLSYTCYESAYKRIQASQTMFIPLGDAVELWDVRIKNEDTKKRKLSVFSYCEFSFHHISIDNQNFQMSLYAAGSSYEDGIVEHDLFYEEDGYQYFTSSVEADSYDCLRDTFIGNYRTEDNPIAVERGHCSGSEEKGGNHCGALHKRIVLEPGEEVRILFLLGEGDRDKGREVRAKYRGPDAVDQAFESLKRYWQEKCSRLQIETPNEGMDAMLNIWTLYQAEINIIFSRFASFIEVGGRTGLGYRDTAQDAMTIPHSNPDKCRQRIVELLRGLTSMGYGLHLFQPEWFDKEAPGQSFKSPTVVPTPNREDVVHGLEDTGSDDALWLVGAIVEYIRETGEFAFLDQIVSYADGGEGSVYEHMTKILDFSAEQIGAHGICKGLRADWNDCLNLGGGESTMVTFLHYWALRQFTELAAYLERGQDVRKYQLMMERIDRISETEIWDEEWYIRGITKNGKKIGTTKDREGRVHLESNTWAVLSGAASQDKGIKAMDAVYKNLFTPYGIMLNGPAYTEPDDDIGFVTRVYPGIKENAAIFSHPNPWAWGAECMLGRGSRAMEYYNTLCPYYQNDMIEIRQSEPYSYCQFIMGVDHSAFGRARHPFMTGTGGWAYYAATHYMLGIRPEFDHLVIDPCIPREWPEFKAVRRWRSGTYYIIVKNPDRVEKGVAAMYLNGVKIDRIPDLAGDQEVTVVMGNR